MKKSTLFCCIILAVTGLCLAFTAGYFIGNTPSDGAISIEVLEQAPQEALTVTVTASPALVDINDAPAQVLESLTGIGPSLAEAIVADREANGDFLSPEDLLRVAGIGESTLAGFIGEITLNIDPDALAVEETDGDDTPALVNINTATVEELATLTGIGSTRAASIIADREKNGDFTSPEDLMRVSGIGEGILAGLIDQITTEHPETDTEADSEAIPAEEE